MASASIKIIGLPELNARLKKKIEEIDGATTAGLLAAGLKVQALSQKRVPVEYGTLRASAFTRKDKDDGVEIGYGAPYAIFVHENMEMKLKGQPRASWKGVYWGPSGRSKFLESALIDSEKTIVDTIAEYAKSKAENK